MTSAGPTVIDPPEAAEDLPRWLTLREAAFVSGIEEDELQAWVISGNVRCDRSLSRRLGDHYLLVLSEDLVAAGLLEAPSQPARTEPPTAPPSAPTPTATALAPPTERLAPADVVSITPSQDRPPSAAAEAAIEGAPLPAVVPLRETGAVVWSNVFPAMRQGLRWVKVGLLLGLLLAASLPLALRYRTFPVTSASMAPALHSGDLMFVRAVGADKVRVGDVVAFRQASDGRVVAGRVKAVESSSGMVHVETETDASRTIRRWTVPAGGSIDLVRYRVSLLGRALKRLPPDAMRWVPYGLPGVVFVVFLVIAVRMRPRRPVPVEAAA
jgi:signal peptidase